MGKCKCKWRCDGIVFDEDCTKVIRKWCCDVDSYDPDTGCNRNCSGYAKKEEARKEDS